MFDVTESIEEKYLFNFSDKEKKAFRQEHILNRRLFYKSQARLYELLARESPAIFRNEPSIPSSIYEIRYTFNRLKKNDPRETELLLDMTDPIVRNDFCVSQIVDSFKNNTCCQTVVLNGVRLFPPEMTGIRSFNDDEALTILQALSHKKLSELTFANAPLLTDKTFQYIATAISDRKNQWGHVTLGDVVMAPTLAKKLKKSGKVSFNPVNQTLIKRGLWHTFWKRFEGRVRNT